MHIAFQVCFLTGGCTNCWQRSWSLMAGLASLLLFWWTYPCSQRTSLWEKGLASLLSVARYSPQPLCWLPVLVNPADEETVSWITSLKPEDFDTSLTIPIRATPSEMKTTSCTDRVWMKNGVWAWSRSFWASLSIRSLSLRPQALTSLVMTASFIWFLCVTPFLTPLLRWTYSAGVLALSPAENPAQNHRQNNQKQDLVF